MLKPFLLIYCVFIIVPLTHTTDYCKICKNNSHTMCKYKGVAKSCHNYNSIEMTPKIRAKIENLHNEYRNKVALGQENRGNPGPQPTSTNILLMKWDDELSQIAQRWAAQCRSPTQVNQHDECKRTERFDVGQNVIQGIRGHTSLESEELITKMIELWYAEVDRMNSDEVTKFQGIKGRNKEVGHYAQIIWAKTKYIGCAHASFSENFTRSNITSDETVDTLVCNYGPTGNIIGAPLYTIGKPCSECKCMKKYPALCEEKEPEFTHTVEKPTKGEVSHPTETKTESQYLKSTSSFPIYLLPELRSHIIQLRRRDGDDCSCLFRVSNSANVFLPAPYLLYLFLLILYY